MKSLILFIVSIIFASNLSAQTGEKKNMTDLKNTALLVIDIQNFYFEKGRIPLVGSVEASLKAKRVLEKMREKKNPIIHIAHIPKIAEGKYADPNDFQNQFHENVKPLPNEKIVIKHFYNSFKETELLEYLNSLGIKNLIITGMQTHMCVEAATRAGKDLGFDITIIEDACATRDLKYKDETIPAKTVHLTVLSELNGSYARIINLDEFLDEIK
jgi:nicotinamidase-related amidase